MSAAPAARERARHPEEETRYRAVGALDASDAEDRAELLLRLGDASWRVRSAAAERLAGAADPLAVVPALVDALARGPDPGARDAAGAALARIGAPAVPALLEGLSAADGGARQAVAAALGEIADRRAVVPLAARLADPDPNVRAAAAEALGRLGGPDAGAALLAALDSDDATLRLAAVEALAALHLPVPAARLAPLLADRILRVAAYRLLGAAPLDAAVRDALAAGLASPSRVAREAALAALGEQRSRAGAGPDAGPEAGLLSAAVRGAASATGATKAWAAALADDDPAVVSGALAALGWAGDVAHAAAIAGRAEDDRFRGAVEDALEALPPSAALRQVLAEAAPRLPPLARITALAALARLGATDALHALAARTTDPEPQVQAEAIAALGRTGDARAVVPLAGLLGDDAPTVSGLAAAALVRLALAAEAGRAAVLAGCRARAAASPSSAAFRVLGAVGDAADLPGIRAGLGSGVVIHRIAAAGALAALGRRGLLAAGIPELADALADPAWAVRAAAARAIAEIGRAHGCGGRGCPLEASCARMGPALVAALTDPEDAVRASAAEALGACGRREQRGALARLATPDAPPLVAVAALRALEALGEPPVPVLARAITHRDAEVVKAAVAAAAASPDPAAAALLREAAGSPRWDVRHAAAQAMARRGDPSLGADAARCARLEPDPLVARAFAEAAEALGARGSGGGST